MTNFRNINSHNNFIWLYTITFLSMFIFIFWHNIAIQKIPNFNYRILPTGQWQIIDNSHPTMNTNTIVTAIEIDKKNHKLNKNWLRNSFYGIESQQKQKQAFANENLLYQASKNHKTVPIKLIDSQGKIHNFELRMSNISDIQLYTWALYGLGLLKLLIGFFAARVTEIKENTLVFLVLTAVMGFHCFYSIAALGRVWAVNPDMLYDRLIIVVLLFRLYTFTVMIMWLRVPNNLFQHFKFLKILSVVVLVIVVGTWLIYSYADVFNLELSYDVMIVIPIYLTLVISYLAIYLQWRLVHKAPLIRPKLQPKVNHINEPGKNNKNFVVNHFNISQSLALRWMFVLLIVGESTSIFSNLLIRLGVIDSEHSLAMVYIHSTIVSIGTVALMAHKHLYKIEAWWQQVWGVFFAFSAGNASMMILNATALNSVGISAVFSSIIALLTYFAVVYYLQVKYAETETEILTIAMPQLMTINSQNLTLEAINNVWKEILIQVFQPKYIQLKSKEEALLTTNLALSNHDDAHDLILICDAGEVMLIQAVDDKVFVLTYATNGLKLFTPHNVTNATLLWNMVKQAHKLTTAYHEGERAERKRIACDLHDDVGGKLLHLSSQGGEYGEYARRTLKDLRTLTHVLSGENKSLDLLIADLRYQIRSYCDAQEIQLTFTSSLSDTITQNNMSAQASIHFSCIMNELVRNALQNKNTKKIWITIDANDDECSLVIENDGDTTNPKNWKSGLGTISVKRRINVLCGYINWHARDEGGVKCESKWQTSSLY